MGRAVNSLPGFATAKGAYSLSPVGTVPIGRQCHPVKEFLIVFVVSNSMAVSNFSGQDFQFAKEFAQVDPEEDRPFQVC